jgi:hypothetical protein
MSYAAVIDQANPTAFMFLIDQSRSMNEKMDGGETKAKFVGDVLNKTLLQLMTRCNSADGVRDYFDIGVLAYSGTGVHSGFGGVLSASSLHPISTLATHPLRIEQRKQRVPDDAGGLVEQSVKFPVWINSVSVGDTLMCEGFRQAAECLVRWCNSHAKSHPPTIIHVTGGPSTDGNPEQLAEAIRHISTNVGQCLLFNLHVDVSGSASVVFPASEASLPDTYSKMLFRMSSLFPTHLIKPANEKGYSASAKSRFFGYKTGYRDLVNFFDIGTRVSSLLLRESMSVQSGQTFARPTTGRGTNDESDQKPWPAQRAKTQAAETAKPQPAEPGSGILGHRRSTGRHVVRMLGLAVGIIAAIIFFKFSGTGRGPQPAQFSNQAPTIAAKDDAASKRQSSDNGQSIGPSTAPNVTAADSNSERNAAVVPNELVTEPAQMRAPMPAPKNIDQPRVAVTSSVDPSSTTGETGAESPSIATTNLNLAQIPDAKRVQQRLIDLGYLSGVAAGVWGPNSKRALSEFRKAEKLGQDDNWDQATEAKLFSTSTVRKQQSLTFVGAWSKDATSCADIPIKITASRAMSRDATCELKSVRQVAEGRWRIQAHCELDSSLQTADTENSWTSNIKLTLDDRRLTWESEKGAEDYYRCSQ